ncbi:hypothetical protein, partial [Novosphingobium mangrovi (ex Hu et al. 2023)]
MNALLLLGLAAAAVLPNPSGIWDLRVDQTTIFRFEVRNTPRGIEATWERPEHFQLDGDTFSQVSGPSLRR